MRRLTLLLLLISGKLAAQPPCTTPGTTPSTSTVVCGTSVFSQPNLPSCNGINIPYPGYAGLVSDNAAFYSFHCYQAGSFGFLLTPLSPADDYDWSIMDITGFNPNDIYTNNLNISVNLSGTPGPTGCTPTGIGNSNCAGGTPQFNAMPMLQAGHDYLLMVSNWSSSGLGYNMTFSGGTTILGDNAAPTITSVGPVGCNSSLVRVQFSEPVLCSTATPAGSEFTITAGTHVITGIVSQCVTGVNAFTELTIQLQNPLPAGNYNLVVNNGTDANTLHDVCQTPMTAGSSFPFTITSQPAPLIDTLMYNGCAPTVLKVALNKIITCSSVTANGSEFSITPGNPAIASVQTICSGTPATTDTVLITLQHPLPFGNYQLTVNNGSDGNTLVDTCGTSIAAGYLFPFVISQVTTAPAIQSVNFDECKPFKLLINFDKPVACNSISANGSEFTVTPGTLTVASINTGCVSGFTNQVELTLSGNLPAGNFNVSINNGTDGNTIADSCFAFVTAPSVFPFTTTQAPAPVYDSLQYDECSPNVIRVFYSNAILCSSVNSNGSEFSITGPSAVTIAGVTTDATCTTGYTNSILLNLAQPINTFGTYTLHNVAGSDGNSVTDTCFAAQNISETISFDVLGRPSAAFEDSVHFGCTIDTLVVSHAGGNGINSWQWTFSDGTVVNGPTASHTFPASNPNASVQLIVSNGVCADTLSSTYTLNNAFTAGFSIDRDTLCRNTSLAVVNSSIGNNLAYHWNFGDGNIFNGQSPPPHAYTAPGNYDITLTVTNHLGCVEDSILNITVTDTPTVRFAGLNSQYCTGEAVNLSTNIVGDNVVNYSWNNGNGIVNTNQPTVNYTYNNEGNYQITLSATDRYCGNYSYSESTQVYKVPVFNLGPDITLCPGMQTTIGVSPITGYTYLWNNGATTSQIISALATSNYSLTIDNNGCTATDEMVVTVMDHCLIKVPGAFTPNNDGLNDRLRAINADLAREFSMLVYNRFGQLVFSTSVPTDGWDGTFKGVAATAGTYVWQLRYIHPTTGQKVYEKGTSILIR